MKSQEIKQEDLKKGGFKFVGFIRETQINNLKKGLFYFKTKNSDLISEVFGVEKEKVYIYKKLKEVLK